MEKTIFYSLAALVRKILFCHSKIKFISSRHRVISSIYLTELCVLCVTNEHFVMRIIRNLYHISIQSGISGLAAFLGHQSSVITSKRLTTREAVTFFLLLLIISLSLFVLRKSLIPVFLMIICSDCSSTRAFECKHSVLVRFLVTFTNCNEN